MGKLAIACSPLTNTIFAGTVLKEGTFGKNKEDVTLDALFAVAEHCDRFQVSDKEAVQISDGKVRYTIKIDKEIL